MQKRALERTLPLLTLLVTAALVPAACSKDPAVPTPTLDAGFAFGLDAGDPGDAGDAGDAAPLASGSAVPSGSVAASASAAASGLAVAGLDAALDAAMAAQAQKDAPGMAAEGQPGRATLQGNEHFGMIVNMAPGRCYTIIALSAPAQVTQLEARLLAPPLYNLDAGRSAATDKNPAVIGRGKTPICPLAPIAVPYKVDVAAKQGAGRVLVQVFAKSK